MAIIYVSHSMVFGEAMSGILYGVGLGPGDPDLITLKSSKLISAAQVIAYPTLAGGNSFARSIAADLIKKGTEEIVIGSGVKELFFNIMASTISKNDEVITQALTFVATANAILYNNAQPVFLDVDIDTMGLSPKSVEAFLEEHGELREEGCFNKTTGRKIAACMPPCCD